MILVMMHQHNGGAIWTNSSGWLTNGDHCLLWNGITCDEQYMGRAGYLRRNVISLDMSNNNFIGSIYPRISEFKKLKELFLDLNAHYLSPIPDEICELTDLSVTGDEESCNHALTAEGCCDNTRASPSTLAQITENVLGNADCNALSVTADVSTCQWMLQGRAAHPAHKTEDLTEYLTVSAS